ncbi:MAG: histidine--tRNA ligase [Firmicutes bacterium]|nr:histidine--tRNA ligase [Bacillota bacterium]
MTGTTRGDEPWLSIPGGAGPGQGKKVVLVCGDEEYRSEEALPQLAKILAQRHGFDCTVLFPIDKTDGTINPEERSNIPGLEALRDADLLILFTRFRDLPDEQMKHIVDYVDSGLPEGDPLPPLPEGCFGLMDPEVAAEPLVRLMREFRPHVVLTYDENGGYPHPDHIMCHKVSVIAFDAAGDPDRYPGTGDPWQPLKLYYVASMFRYDRPQKGRYRQHTQFGAEIIGSPDPAADAEVLSLPVRFLQALGLAHVEVRLNSVGDAACRPRYLEALRAYFRPHLEALCADCQRRFAQQPLRLLECKQEGCRRVAAGAPAIFDLLCAPCAAHFDAVRTYLEALGIPYVLDRFIVRGMDYYTRTAFEVYSGRLGAQNAVFGGGRYDGLAEQLGGTPTPGVGFGLGLDRLLLVLEQEELLPAPPRGVDVMVVTIGEAARPVGLRLADELRAAGQRVEVDLLGRDVRAQMRHAHRLGARIAVILGDAELAAGTVTVRAMATGQQEVVARGALPALLRDRRDGEAVR